jgi:hypothetical protein
MEALNAPYEVGTKLELESKLDFVRSLMVPPLTPRTHRQTVNLYGVGFCYILRKWCSWKLSWRWIVEF